MGSQPERRVTPMRGRLAGAMVDTPGPEGVTYRSLGADDGPALGRLMADAYRGSVDDGGESEAWHLDEAVGTLQGRYGDMRWDGSVVAESSDSLIGACVVTFNRGRLLLAFALVSRAWHGQGIGTALMARSAGMLSAAREEEWTLAVTEGNPARALYERLGFQVDESLRSS